VISEHLALRGIGTAGLGRRDTAVVIALTGEEHSTVVVDTAALELRSVNGLDPTIGIVQVGGDRVGAIGRSESPPSAWANAVATGQLAVAQELVGASKAMLQLARDHARERIQFGRPIAAFQAVRHRLAESLVAIEAAEAALGAAWDVGSPFDAALAKAIAGRSARTVALHGQQVLAGIGFTAEHAFHHYVRRTLMLDGLFGDLRSLTRELGEELLRTRRLPSILPL
jgi:alkylation response protein AidB-like acyl-CoA dehydrogenase